MTDWHGAIVINERTKERAEYESLSEALGDLKQRGYHADRYSESFDGGVMGFPHYHVSWGTEHKDDANYLVLPLNTLA